MGNLAKISAPENYFTPLWDFIVAEGSCQSYVAKLFPRQGQYLTHTDSHDQRAVTAVLSLGRLTYTVPWVSVHVQFPVSVSFIVTFADLPLVALD